MIILYTCEAGKILQATGDRFYASKERDGAHVIPFETGEDQIDNNWFATKHDMVYLKKNSIVSWL